MKHLLTALITMLVLALPLLADEPAQTISVRVIDHEGEPISSIPIKSMAGSAKAESVTDDTGLAQFDLELVTKAQTVLVWPHGSLYFPERRAGSSNSQPEVDLTLFDRYAFDRVTRFDIDAFGKETLVIQVPESVQCNIRVYPSEIAAMAPRSYGLQRRGGPRLKWERHGGDPFGWFDGESQPWSVVTSLPIPRGEAAQIAVKVDSRFYVG